MKKKFTFSKGIRNSLIIFFLGIILITGGCYTIEYIIQPDVVRPNSAFNVKISVQLAGEYETADYLPGYGILGILLPDGWTIKDSPEYRIIGLIEKKGLFTYSNSVVSFLNSFASKPPSGYHWWGAKTSDQINIASLDSGFIDLTILTNEKIGQFITKYILGDDIDWNKSSAKDPFGIVTESTILSVRSDLSLNVEKSWENEAWEVYPNPSDGQVYIRQTGFIDGIVMKIYDLNGRLQKSETLSANLNSVDLSKLSKGIYIISLEKHGEVKTKQLIIK